MKKLLINLPCTAGRALVVLVFLLLLVQLAAAQKADTLASHPFTPMYDIYMHGSKTCKTVAWAFLASGATLGIIGLTDARSSGPFFSPGFDTGITLMFVGGLMVIPSIPLFITARNNKKKAMLQLKTGTIQGPGRFNYTAVALKLNL